MVKPSSIRHYFLLGAEVSLVESIIVLLGPIGLYFSPFGSFSLWHAALQLALFIPLVQIPAFVFNRMSYVDIGWPVGVVMLAVTTFIYADGYWLRKYVTCACLLLHGGRMAFGALVIFFPYKFPQDLPRYQYAYLRWVKRTKMPPSSWKFKIQHDTLQQAFFQRGRARYAYHDVYLQQIRIDITFGGIWLVQLDVLLVYGKLG